MIIQLVSTRQESHVDFLLILCSMQSHMYAYTCYRCDGFVQLFVGEVTFVVVSSFYSFG